MSLYIASINSGSNGNCYYVGNEQDAVLIDAGLSCLEIEKRMKLLQLDMQKLRAIFISHEHSDHIRGLEILAKKYKLPVYITAPTLYHGGIALHAEQVVNFSCGNAVSIGDLIVTPFSKHHDASDPYSFIVSHQHVTVGIFTDLGKCCDKLVHYFSKCHAAFLESNYDEEMLNNGNYPWHLKQRIRGGKGHLSNREALQLFTQHGSKYLQLLLLSHLSANNNRPEIVQQLFDAHAKRVKMMVASRHEPSPVYCITASEPVVKQTLAVQQMSFDFA